jgi:hypothetical protein
MPPASSALLAELQAFVRACAAAPPADAAALAAAVRGSPLAAVAAQLAARAAEPARAHVQPLSLQELALAAAALEVVRLWALDAALRAPQAFLCATAARLARSLAALVDGGAEPLERALLAGATGPHALLCGRGGGSGYGGGGGGGGVGGGSNGDSGGGDSGDKLGNGDGKGASNSAVLLGAALEDGGAGSLGAALEEGLAQMLGVLLHDRCDVRLVDRGAPACFAAALLLRRRGAPGHLEAMRARLPARPAAQALLAIASGALARQRRRRRSEACLLCGHD